MNEGKALPVVADAPDLAEGTAGVELAGEAERAVAAKSEAFLCPGRRRKMAPREMPTEGELRLVPTVANSVAEGR